MDESTKILIGGIGLLIVFLSGLALVGAVMILLWGGSAGPSQVAPVIEATDIRTPEPKIALPPEPQTPDPGIALPPEPQTPEPEIALTSEPVSNGPTTADLEIDKAVWEAQEANPARDAITYIANRRGLSDERVTDAVVAVAERQQWLAIRVENAGSGVVGEVQVVGVSRTELGPYTASLSITVIGCPNRSALDFLAQAAVGTIVGNMPKGIDGFTAGLWYRGLTCDRGYLGSATWNAGTGLVTFQ